MDIFKLTIYKQAPIALGVSPDLLFHIRRSWAQSLPWITWYESQLHIPNPIAFAQLLGIIRQQNPIIIPHGIKTLEVYDFEDLFPAAIESIIQSVNACKSIERVVLIGFLPASTVGYLNADKTLRLINALPIDSVQVIVPTGYNHQAKVLDFSEGTQSQIESAITLNIKTLKSQAKVGVIADYVILEQDNVIPLLPSNIFLASCLASKITFIKRL